MRYYALPFRTNQSIKQLSIDPSGAETELFHKTLAVDVLVQYIPRNMHTVFALLCFAVVIH